MRLKQRKDSALLPVLQWLLESSVDASPAFSRELAAAVSSASLYALQHSANDQDPLLSTAVHLLPVLVNILCFGEHYMLPGGFNVVLDNMTR